MSKNYFTVSIIVLLAALFVTNVSEGAVNISQAVVTTVAGQTATSGSEDGSGTAARFSFAAGLTTDGTSMYVVDTYNQTIRKFEIETGEVTTLAGRPGVVGSTDGVGAAALFNYPQGITSDGSNLYVADTNNCTIRKIDIATGKVSTLAGTAGHFGSTNGIGPSAKFASPYGIAIEGENLYVADTYNGTVRKVVISTGAVTTLAGTANIFGFADGMGAAAQFKFVSGITSDGINLYVVDRGSNLIRRIVIESGEVTTIAGAEGFSGSNDGPGELALFSSPQNIVADKNSIYVTDSGNSVIREIDVKTNYVTTIANQSEELSSIDGNYNSTGLFNPYGIAINKGKLYITDIYTIRKIE